MVALAVPRLGYTPTLCLARPMLFAALDCYDRKDYIGAGVRLREAVKRFVVAACQWYDVKVDAQFLTPKAYARALRKANHIDKWGLEILLECINAGNKLAHCEKVDRHAISGGISLLFSLMDSEPYTGHERKPTATSHKTEGYDVDDCDDDDGANWWKIGGAA